MRILGAESEMYLLLLFREQNGQPQSRGVWGFTGDKSANFLRRFYVIGKVVALQKTDGTWDLTSFHGGGTEAGKVEVTCTSPGLNPLNSPPVSILLPPFLIWRWRRKKECR